MPEVYIKDLRYLRYLRETYSYYSARLSPYPLACTWDLFRNMFMAHK